MGDTTPKRVPQILLALTRLFSRRKLSSDFGGSDFGGVDLVRRIAGGKAAEIYHAYHPGLDRQLVAKILPATRLTPLNTQRFQLETQVLSQLSHPNVVAFLRSGTNRDGALYCLMEHVRGLNLFELVNRFGSLGDGRAIHILTEVCSGLAEVHGQGFIHGDVSPKNIMLTNAEGVGETVKVLDFGVVRLSATLLDGEIDGKIGQPPRSGWISGTPAFISPEACQEPAAVCEQSDIYSLGCVAFLLLTGKLPFPGATPIEICWKQVHKGCPALSANGTNPIAPELENLVMRCLAKSPADRPSSMFEVRDTLQRCRPCVPWTSRDSANWWHENNSSGQG